MKLKKKLLIGIIIVMCILAIGTNVSALSLKSTVDDLRAKLTDNYNTEFRILREHVSRFKELFCLNPNVNIPNSDAAWACWARYTEAYVGNETDPRIAYVLAYAQQSGYVEASDMFNQEAQIALWLLLNTTIPDNVNEALGARLAAEAEAYAEYKEQGDTITTSAAENINFNGTVYGPFSVTHPESTYTATVNGTTVSGGFGLLEDAQITSSNSIYSYSVGNDWNFTDENGTPISYPRVWRKFLYKNK